MSIGQAGLRISICSESRTKVSSAGNKFLNQGFSNNVNEFSEMFPATIMLGSSDQ